MIKTLDDFYRDLGLREASGRYDNVNDFNYLGMYQMGEAALVDTGYYTDSHINHSGKCDWAGTFTGKDGVYSKEDFKNNSQAQENANKEYKQIQWKQLKKEGAVDFLDTYVDGVLVTQSGLLAAAHLKGAKGTAEYLKNPKNSSSTDALGTSIKEYLKKFAGYDVSEITGLPSDAFEFENTKKNVTNQENIKNVSCQKENPFEKLVDRTARILLATVMYAFYCYGMELGAYQPASETIKQILSIVAKNNGLSIDELLNILIDKIKELDAFSERKYLIKKYNLKQKNKNIRKPFFDELDFKNNKFGYFQDRGNFQNKILNFENSITQNTFPKNQYNLNNYSYPDLKITPETSVQISDSLKNYKNNNENNISGNVSEILNSLKQSSPIELSQFDLEDYYPKKTDYVELDMSEPKRTQSTDYSYYKQKEQSNIDIGQLLSNLINIFGSVE